MALFSAAATITGTAIGAGFLGIPYVVAKSGLFIGIVHMVVLGLLIMLINLYLGEITLRTRKNHQFPGYAKLYLGNIGRLIMLATMIFGIYSALVAYFIAEGQTLSFIIFGSQEQALAMSFLFFAFIFALVFLIIAIYLAKLTDILRKNAHKEKLTNKLTKLPNRLALMEDLANKKFKNSLIVLISAKNILKIQGESK